MSDNAEITALKAEIAEIKARLPQRSQGKAPDEVPLAVCNQVAKRAQAEIKAEKQDAATLAKSAIDAAFADRKAAKARPQKSISPVLAERLAKKA